MEGEYAEVEEGQLAVLPQRTWCASAARSGRSPVKHAGRKRATTGGSPRICVGRRDAASAGLEVYRGGEAPRGEDELARRTSSPDAPSGGRTG